MENTHFSLTNKIKKITTKQIIGTFALAATIGIGCIYSAELSDTIFLKPGERQFTPTMFSDPDPQPPIVK